MDFNSLTLDNGDGLSDWMLFSLSIGSLLKTQKDEEQSLNLYISVPNSITFTYFLFQGLYHQDAIRKIRKNKITKRFLELEKGSIVYYDDHGIWRRCSVVSIEKNYTPNSKYHLQIQLNKKVKQFIPDRDWTNKLIISDMYNETILNARAMKDFEDFSGPLSSLYNPKSIKALEIMGEPTAYIVGNRAEFEKYLDVINFIYDTIKFTHKDIIHFSSTKHYKNLRWLKTNEDNVVLDTDDYIIFLGSSKALTSLYKDKNCNKIFVDDQFENPTASEELRLFIEQQIIIEERLLHTNSIMSGLDVNGITIPNGVNLIAWK